MTIIEKLSKALQVETISHKAKEAKPNAFDEYIGLMSDLFPLVHKKCTKEMINDYSFIYHYKSHSSKEPIILIAHYDVVPIESKTRDQWTYSPFSGEIADGYVWGRGALDTKITMISALEALEQVIEEGIEPSRDIYLAFGHDEEVFGRNGAAKIVEHFKEAGIGFEYLIDEGGCVTVDSIGEVKKPVAVVGIGEKGYADIELKITSDSGHSSTPPPHTSVGMMSQVINRLENNQRPMSLVATKGFFKKIGPEMVGAQKFIVTNLWLFGPLFKRIFSKTPNGNALLRTTTAATMISGSMKPNVLPKVVTAVVNFRIASHETLEDIVNHVKYQGRDLPLEVKVLDGANPSRLSSDQSAGFKLIEKGINEVFGDVVVAPYLTLARTDSAQYEPVVKDMYRFAPYMVTKAELATIHSVNERISEKNVNDGLSFYKYIIKNC